MGDIDVFRAVMPRADRNQLELAARLAQAYGLDPLLGHVVLIPGSARPYPTVAGLRHHAETRGGLGGIKYRALGADERDALFPGAEPGDIAVACVVTRDEACYEEFGFCSAREKGNLKDRSALARTRALGRALRLAYSLALKTADEIDGAPDSIDADAPKPEPVARSVLRPSDAIRERVADEATTRDLPSPEECAGAALGMPPDTVFAWIDAAPRDEARAAWSKIVRWIAAQPARGDGDIDGAPIESGEAGEGA